MEEQFIDESGKDVTHSWVSTSRFIWLCQIFLVLALIAGGCYGLYAHRYKGKPEVNVPDNTLYNPKYK
jgi:hypothetical protein